MSTPAASVPFRADIEGLRAVAVLLVVACHAGLPGCSGGFVGVDVFFVLSGYLITGLLVAELDSRSRLSLGQFYARRARRLLPASALTLLVTVGVGALIASPQELALSARAARAAALYVSNFYFDIEAADYFAADVATNPLLHTWSLGVEEQFYLIWPALLLVGFSLARTRLTLNAVLATVTVASLAICILSTPVRNTFAFYELPARAWEFGAGGLLALHPALMRRAAMRVVAAAGILGLLAIVLAGALMPAGGGAFPGALALIPVGGTLALLAAGSRDPGRAVGWLLCSPPMQYLGARSYSWYLWHWPFVVYAAVLFPGISIAGKALAAAASLAAAALTFRVLESPVRRSRYLIARPVLSLGAAAIVTVLSVGTVTLFIRLADAQSNSVSMQPITAAIADVASIPRDKCVSLAGSTDVKTCTFGDPNGSVKLVLFGDSHAVQWFDAFEEAARRDHWTLTTFLKSACPASDVDLGSLTAPLPVCRAWREEALREIRALRPTAVVMASATGRFSGRYRDDPARWSASLTRDTRRSLETLAAAGIPVIVVRDTPAPPFDVPTCLARVELHAWYPPTACDFDRSASQAAGIFDAERAAATGLAGVHFVDFTDVVCPGNTCRARLGGRVVYRDGDHLAGGFSRSLAAVVGTRLRDALSE